MLISFVLMNHAPSPNISVKRMRTEYELDHSTTRQFIQKFVWSCSLDNYEPCNALHMKHKVFQCDSALPAAMRRFTTENTQTHTLNFPRHSKSTNHDVNFWGTMYVLRFNESIYPIPTNPSPTHTESAPEGPLVRRPTIKQRAFPPDISSSFAPERFLLSQLIESTPQWSDPLHPRTPETTANLQFVCFKTFTHSGHSMSSNTL